MIGFKEFINEAKYEVEVEVRDAPEANSIAKDMFRGLYKNNGSNSFVFKSQDDHDEFKDELSDMGIKLLESVEMNTDFMSPRDMGKKGMLSKNHSSMMRVKADVDFYNTKGEKMSGIVKSKTGSEIKIKGDDGKLYTLTLTEAIQSSDLNESFMRLPVKMIGNDLSTFERNVSAFVSGQRNGDDVDSKKLDSIINQLNIIKRAVKVFKDEKSVPSSYMPESFDMNEAIQSSDLMRIKSLIKYAEKASKENNKGALNHFIQAIQTSGDSIESSKHAQMGNKAMKNESFEMNEAKNDNIIRSKITKEVKEMRASLFDYSNKLNSLGNAMKQMVGPDKNDIKNIKEAEMHIDEARSSLFDIRNKAMKEK